IRNRFRRCPKTLGRFGHTTLIGYARLLVAEGAIQVECGADQCEMRKGLRKIAKRLALRTCLFRIKAQVIRIAQHAFEEEPGLIEPLGMSLAGASQSLNEPKGTHVEGAFFARQTVDARLWRITIH